MQEIKTEINICKDREKNQLRYLMMNCLFLQGFKNNFHNRQILHLLFNTIDNNFPRIRIFGINLLHQFLEKIKFYEVESYTMIILKILKRTFFWKKIKLIKNLLPLLFSFLEKILRKSPRNEFYSLSLIDYFFFEGPIICSKLGHVLFLITILSRSKNLEILKILVTLVSSLVSLCWARVKQHLVYNKKILLFNILFF